LNRRIMQLEIEREAIRRENNVEKEAVLNKEIAELGDKRNALRAQWEKEKEVVNEIRILKENLDQLKFEAENAERAGDYGKVAEIRYGRIPELTKKLEELQQAQGERSLLQEEITAEDVAEIVAKDRKSTRLNSSHVKISY